MSDQRESVCRALILIEIDDADNAKSFRDAQSKLLVRQLMKVVWE